MKACGIVVEYNPFHNGHKYHLDKAKELSKADVIVAVMSSNFVQRGEPAIIDKKQRTIEAIKNGVDLVVELPFLYTVENADLFAKFSVSILNKLKVSNICFGSETGDTEAFLNKYEHSSILLPHLDFKIQDLMDEGYAYPKAMSMALEEIDSYKLEEPNDILGLSYYKEIVKNKYPIDIITIKRTNDYNSIEVKGDVISATALRNQVKLGNDVSRYTSMAKELKENPNVFLEDYFDIFKYKILSTSAEDLRKIHLVSEGIENLFKKQIKTSTTMDEFIKKCSSKRYTFARIKRTIVHIFANTQKEYAKEYLNKDISYIRVLGFNKKGKEYLNTIRKEIEIPVISKFKSKSFKVLSNEKDVTYVYASKIKEPHRTKIYDEEHFIFPIRMD